jgi:hypothetical protein
VPSKNLKRKIFEILKNIFRNLIKSFKILTNNKKREIKKFKKNMNKLLNIKKNVEI